MPLVVGFILYMLVGLLHADGPTNNQRAVLAVYASSARRTAVHLGQFVGMAVLIAELLALYFALDLRAVGAAWLARLELSLRWWRLGSTPSCRRWDGVALKQPVDAERAPDAEKRHASPVLRHFDG